MTDLDPHDRTAATEKRGHHVEWWVCTPHPWVDAQFGCYEPEGADCRLICPEGCEEWAPDHQHPLVDGGECNALTFFNNADEPTDCYSGPSALIQNGPIDIEWDGDQYVWYYPTTEAKSA